ncbi:MAG: hypothetical protein ACE5G2_05695 [Candidatus Krumholzibacteriia bacterium]
MTVAFLILMLPKSVMMRPLAQITWRIMAAVGILPLLPTNTLAGAWTQQKSGYYFSISASYFFTEEEYNHKGERVSIFDERVGFENASFRDFTIAAYFEYGVMDRLTLVATLPFKILTSEWDTFLAGDILAGSQSINTVGLADLTLSARYSILAKPVVLALQGGIKTPLGYEERPEDDGAPLGTGEVDGEAHLLLGTSLYPVPLYLTTGIGYRLRGGPLHDEIVYSAEVGYQLDKVLFKINLDGIRNTITPPDLAGLPVVTPLPGGGGAPLTVIVGDQHVTKISPSIIYSIRDGLGIQGEIRHALAGTNTTSGTAFSLGIVISR